MEEAAHAAPGFPRWKIVASIAMLLASIGVLAGLVRGESETAALRETSSTPTVTVPQTQPTATPTPSTERDRDLGPTPAPLPTPIDIEPTGAPGPSLIAPQPTPARPVATPGPPPPTPPQRPEPWQWQVTDSRFIAMTSEGLWTSNSRMRQEQFHDPPAEYTISQRCRQAVGATVFVTAQRDSSDAPTLLSFDLATHQWHTVSDLPHDGADDTAQAPLGSAYCAMTAVENTLVVAAASTDQLKLVMVDADEPLREHVISFPKEWRGSAFVDRVEVIGLATHGDELIVRLCTYRWVDEQCLLHLLALDLAALMASEEISVAWSDVDGRAIVPSAEYIGDLVDVLTGVGVSTDAIDLVQVGDDVWHLERYNSLGSARLDFSADHGSWRAAPLGEPLIAFPRGLRPRLFPFEDTAVAAVPLSLTPNAQGPVRYFTDYDWWMYDKAARTWAPIEDPLVAPFSFPIGESLPFDGRLFVVRDGIAGFVPATAAPAATWDQVLDEYSTPTVVGDRLYFLDHELLWTSDDRGLSWYSTRYPEHFSSQTRATCGAHTPDDFAYVMMDGRVAKQFVVESPSAERRVIDLPRQARPSYSASYLIPGCRAVEVGGIWHLARIDLDRGLLLIDSIDQAGAVAERTLDIAGEWRDTIRPGGYAPSVDLYRDGDRVVVHICTYDEGAMCRYNDFSFDISLLSAAAPTELNAQALHDQSPSLFFAPNDHPFGAAERLHQVGDSLWRSDRDQIAGECICGEGGSLAPYWTWVGGRYDGPAEDPGNRTVSFSSLSGAVLRCGSNAIPETARVRDEADFSEPDPTIRCERLSDAGQWLPYTAPRSVDWATVPAGVPVQFADRHEDGTILVTPLAPVS